LQKKLRQEYNSAAPALVRSLVLSLTPDFNLKDILTERQQIKKDTNLAFNSF
jgi:hypothetical protein